MFFTKILLINPLSVYVKQQAVIPLGLLSIATCLTSRGHTVKIYDRIVEGGSVKKHLNAFKPDIVGVSIIGGRCFGDAVRVSRAAKQRKIPVVWGGQMASAIPEVILESGEADYVIMGDGEITMLDLVNALRDKAPLRGVDGLAFFENSRVVINRDREFADMKDLPVIDFRFVDPRKYFIRNRSCQRMLHIYLSKGCTGKCAYCYSPAFSRCVWRAKPAGHYLSELRNLIENYGMDGVYFVDDLLSPNKEHLVSLCRTLNESGLKFFWSCDMRVDLMTKEELKMMFDAGCRWIFFGIESGTAENQRAIRKKLNLEKARETIDYCNEIGLFTTVSFITALPGETEEDLKNTIAYMKELNAKVKIPGMFGPFPKTEMTETLIKAGKMDRPRTLAQWGKLATMDTIGRNFSFVPDRDLKVISACFLLAIFTNKYELDDAEKRLWAKRLFGQAADKVKRMNLAAFGQLLLSVKEFAGIVFYAAAFPGIRKKYGLNGLGGKKL